MSMPAPTPTDSSHGVAVHCRGLTKSYGSGEAEVRALRGIDLDIRYGELTMLVGPSGSGKTTLISVIAGILDQDAGDSIVLNQNFKQMSGDDRARFRASSLGFVFQSFNLIPSLTVAENVAVPLLINQMPRKEAIEPAKAILDSVGLGKRAGALPSQLSGGEQQRVAIARALIHDPKLIVCDEPTSNLDHATGRRVMEMLKQAAQTPGRALVIVTHDSRIFEFADRIAHMDDGMIAEVTGGGSSEAAT